MKGLKKLFANLDPGYKNTLFFALGSSFDKIAALVSLPFLTHALAVQDYGKLELLLALYVLYRVVSSLNLIQSVARFSGKYRKANNESGLFSTITTLVLINSLILALLLYGTNRFFRFDFVNPEIVTIWLLANAFRDFATAYLKFTGRIIFSTIESIAYASSLATSVILLHHYGHLTIESFLLAKCSLSVVSVSLILICSKLHPKQYHFDSNIAKTTLHYSIPFAASSLFLIGFQYIDRFMISSMLTLEDLGIYGLAVKIASFFAIFSTSISTSIGPIIYASHEHADTPARIKRYFLIYNIAGIFIGVTLIALAKSIFQLGFINPSYDGALQYIPLLSLIQIISGYNTFFPGLNIQSKTKTLMLINLSGLAGIILLNLILIPFMGVFGALYSSLASLAATQFIIYAKAQKHYPLQLPILPMTCAVTALFLMIDWLQK